jgi:hypothetical protein
MGWDSNPRWTCAHAGFQDRCLKPLGHPSVVIFQPLRQNALIQFRDIGTELAPKSFSYGSRFIPVVRLSGPRQPPQQRLPADLATSGHRYSASPTHWHGRLAEMT